MTKKSKDWKKFKDENTVENESLLEEAPSLNQEPNALSHASYQELEEQLTLSEQQVHEYKDKLMRAMAEVDNVRRGAQRDVANALKFGLEKMITNLLPIMDSLEQALSLAQTDSMREGLELTIKLLLDVLNKQGVQEINPVGDVFNPQEHEAMSMQESTEHTTNTVMLVFQKGYKLNDRVIRAARVIVAK